MSQVSSFFILLPVLVRCLTPAGLVLDDEEEGLAAPGLPLLLMMLLLLLLVADDT